MANTDNKCSDLNVEDFYTGVEDTFGLIYNKQKELQARLGFDFTGWTLKQIADAQNVDIADVKATLTSDFKAHLDEEVASGEHTQAEADAKLVELEQSLRKLLV